MQNKSSKSLYNYWNEIRGSRSAPERRNIDPTKIRTALSDTFILEAVEDEEFSFRLVGSHIYSIYCRELKKRNFNDLWNEKDHDAIKTLVRAVTEDHAVAVASFQGINEAGAIANFEVILLPLHHNGSTNNRLLGAMSVVDEPYWLGTQPVVNQRITGLRLIWPDDLSLQKQTSDIFTKVETDIIWDKQLNEIKEKNIIQIPLPATVHGNKARRYSHLAVIDGGKTNI